MTFHVRQQLRDAVVGVLKGATDAGQNVWPGRTWPIARETKTALLVFLEGGTSLFDAMGPLSLMRQERLVVQAIVRTTNKEPEDALHALAAQVEPLLASDATLAGLALAVELVNTEILARAEGDDRVGEMKLTYSLPVRTTAADPTTRL